MNRAPFFYLQHPFTDGRVARPCDIVVKVTRKLVLE